MLPTIPEGQTSTEVQFQDPLEMLRAMQEGLRELGPGATLLPADSPPKIAFVLYASSAQIAVDGEKRWVFTISLGDFKANFKSLKPGIFDLMVTSGGRAEFAMMLVQGLSLGHIEAYLSDTIVKYVRKRAEAMEADAKAERSRVSDYEAQRAIGGVRIFGQNGQHPGGNAFVLDTKAAALRELARDLAFQRHLA